MLLKLLFYNFGISFRISSHVVVLYFSSNVLMYRLQKLNEIIDLKQVSHRHVYSCILLKDTKDPRYIIDYILKTTSDKNLHLHESIANWL